MNIYWKFNFFMETEHININQFIDKNDVFPSSITVDWCGINFEILRVENSSTPDGIGPRYYNSYRGEFTFDREQLYVGDPVVSANKAAELIDEEFKANNKYIWKYFWSLKYSGPDSEQILNELAPSNGILQTNINNLDSFLKEKQIEDFDDAVLMSINAGDPKIVTHNFLDWYVTYQQIYHAPTYINLGDCLLPCKIPDSAVPTLTFNY